MITSASKHQRFDSPCPASHSLSNHRCQNILYKAVFEHSIELPKIAALLLTSNFFHNSSFGANFIVNYVIDQDTIELLESVLSPSSCFSLQVAPSLHIEQSKYDSEKSNRGISKFVGELVNTKYFSLSLRSLRLDSAAYAVVSHFFGSSSSNSWPQLQDLALECCDVDDTVMQLISKNALQLRNVNFSFNSRITDAGLRYVSALTDITSLNLSYCALVTDDGLEHLSHLPNVASIDLTSCKSITSVGLSHVLNLACISSICLFGCTQVTDTDLENISKVASITSLNLGGCYAIGDAGLDILSTLSGITSLDLSHCINITDAGLEHLSKLAKMISLNLFCVNRITFEAEQKLRNALPKCEII